MADDKKDKPVKPNDLVEIEWLDLAKDFKTPGAKEKVSRSLAEKFVKSKKAKLTKEA